MCGIFGIISSGTVNKFDLDTLVMHAQQRGRDSSGLILFQNGQWHVHRADYRIDKLVGKVNLDGASVVMGHSRLITNGLSDNQPVVRNRVLVLHNGIIVNDEEVWKKLGLDRYQEIDTEIIAAIVEDHIKSDANLEEIPKRIGSVCRGVVATAVALPALGKLLLFSNNGSLYIGRTKDCAYFSSESYPLNLLKCYSVAQVRDMVILDIPQTADEIAIDDCNSRRENLIPKLVLKNVEEKLLIYRDPPIKRCTRCILPETMPYISFDEEGVCNYCRNYKLRNVPRPKEDLFELVAPYRRSQGNDCIVPFSGGRDSCFGLHLIVNELKMKPITYTYDWGMVTDLGRRNISRFCADLGVENIIVADDIPKKRRNIAMNLKSWLKSPHLGMISILTAGDKHFFRHVETVKKQTGINLNLWGVNPLEVTHFKAGFLGVPPDFEEKRVYMHGISKQLNYQWLRLKAMLQSPGYFNRSLWDTISGEYYRSFTEKSDYYHIFDYWRWDEKLINETLGHYDWEKAPDTKATWRIGDGTAAFYNYIYYTVAGFTEHDTFRSNQIREGDITREKALKLVKEENMPRYPNIKWYLDILGFDFKDVISVVNSTATMY